MNGIGSPETPPDIEKLKAAKDYEGLGRALDYRKDPRVQLAAAEALGELGTDKAIRMLFHVLETSALPQDVRDRIVEALRGFNGVIEKAIESYLKQLTWDSSKVVIDEYYDTLETARSNEEESCWHLAAGLRALGSPAVRATIRALGEGADIIHAGYILGAATGDELEELLEVFKYPDKQSFRVILAEAFGYIGDQRAVKLILPLLEDSDDDVRRKAAEALERLDWKPKDDTEQALWHVARHEWRLAARLGKAAVEGLERAVRSPYIVYYFYSYGRLRDASVHSDTRSRAIEVLILIGEPATRALIEALEIIFEYPGLGEVEGDMALHDQSSIIQGLKAIGEPAVDGLLETATNVVDPGPSGAVGALCAILKAGKIEDSARETRVIEHLVGLYLKQEYHDENFYYDIANALCSIESEKVLPFLLPAFHDASESLRKDIVQLVAWMEVSEQDLAKALEVMTPAEQIEYAITLAERGLIRSVDPFLQCLKRCQPDQRLRAIQSLERLKNPIIADVLAQALEDSDLRVQKEAVIALAKLGDDRVIEPLITLLRSSTEATLDYRYVSFLTKFNRSEGVEFLIQQALDEQSPLRVKAIGVLGLLREKRAVETLIKLLQDETESIVTTAANALGLIRDSSSIEALIPLLRDNRWNVRYATSYALGMIGWKPKTSQEIASYLISVSGSMSRRGIVVDVDVVEALFDLLREDKGFSESVYASLCGTRDEQAIARIQTATEDENEAVRRAATRALEIIRGDTESKPS